MADLPIVQLPEGAEAVFEEMERLSRFIDLLDACASHEDARRELSTTLASDWAAFSRSTAPAFREAAATANRADLVQAIDAWTGLYDEREVLNAKKAAWNEHLVARRRKLGDAFGPDFPRKSVLVRDDGKPVGEIETSSAVGCVLSYDAGPGFRRPPVVTQFRTAGGDVVVLRPKLVRLDFHGHSVARVRGIETTFSLRPLPDAARTLHVLATKKLMHVRLDEYERPDGTTDYSRLKLAGPGWTAELLVRDDPRRLMDEHYGEVLRDTVDDADFASLTIDGPGRAGFDVELFQFVLFFATGVEARLLEHQEIAEDGSVVAATIISDRAKEILRHGEIDGWVNSARVLRLWEAVSLLPKDGQHLTQERFRVVVHAMVSALKQPLQNSIVDFYKVLDTLAIHHPSVPRTKMTSEEFSTRNAQQVALLESAAEALQARGEAAAGLDAIVGLVKAQKNDFSVVQRVIKLLESCGVTYNRKDERQKRALDLRHRISHNLAAAMIGDGDGEYSVQQLVEVRNTLLRWALQCTESMVLLVAAPSAPTPPGKDA